METLKNLNVSIRELAQKATGASSLQLGREKMATEELIQAHPDVMTLEQFDIVTMENGKEPKETYVYTIKEEPEKFMFAGAALVKIFKALLETFEGDLGEANEVISKQGGLKFRMEPRTTRNGKEFNRVIVL